MKRVDLEQAAHWHARLADASDGPSGDAVRAAFSAWLQMRGGHRAAYDVIERTDALVRSSANVSELSALGDAAVSRLPAARPGRRRLGAVALVCATCVAPVAAMTLNGWLAPPEQSSAQIYQRTFKTGVGESRQIALAWGGRAELDTASRLDISGATLKVMGQAYISAGQRPVNLAFGDRMVLTTAGDVNVRTWGRDVAILAERAPATVHGATERSIKIDQGHILILGKGAPRALPSPDPGAVTSWRDGWLTFDDVLLEEAAAEINRYQNEPIQLTAARQRLRISGSFRTHDGDGFLKAVERTGFAGVRQNKEVERPSK